MTPPRLTGIYLFCGLQIGKLLQCQLYGQQLPVTNTEDTTREKGTWMHLTQILLRENNSRIWDVHFHNELFTQIGLYKNNLWVKSCFSLSNVARAAELHSNMCLGEVRVVSLDQSTTALTFTRSAFICPLSTVKPKKDTVSMRHIFLPLHRRIGWPDRHVSHAPAGALGKSVYHQGTQTQND